MSIVKRMEKECVAFVNSTERISIPDFRCHLRGEYRVPLKKFDQLIRDILGAILGRLTMGESPGSKSSAQHGDGKEFHHNEGTAARNEWCHKFSGEKQIKQRANP